MLSSKLHRDNASSHVAVITYENIMGLVLVRSFTALYFPDLTPTVYHRFMINSFRAKIFDNLDANVATNSILLQISRLINVGFIFYPKYDKRAVSFIIDSNSEYAVLGYIYFVLFHHHKK